MLKNFFRTLINKKGLSLAEVLISVALISLIMISTMSYFNYAWEARAKNADYNEVLNTVASNLENFKYVATTNITGDALKGKGYFLAGTWQDDAAKKYSEGETARRKKVIYYLSRGDIDNNSYPITSRAVFGGNDIKLVTHVCKNWQK